MHQLGAWRQLVEAGSEHCYKLESKECLAAWDDKPGLGQQLFYLGFERSGGFPHFACSFGYSNENFDPEPEKRAGRRHAKAGQNACSYAVAATDHDVRRRGKAQWLCGIASSDCHTA